MFNHILNRDREVFWTYGDVTCAAFPLKGLDTVSRFLSTMLCKLVIKTVIFLIKQSTYIFILCIFTL